MDTPLPDAARLLAQWDEWEKGETPPGQVLANLKNGGLPDLLAGLVGDSPAES